MIMSLDEVGATLRISRLNLASSSFRNLRRNLDSKLRVMLILVAKKNISLGLKHHGFLGKEMAWPTTA